MDATCAEDRIGYQMPRGWSYSQLLAALWMLGIEFGTPGRVVEPSLQPCGPSLNTLFSVFGDVGVTHPGLCGQITLVLSFTFLTGTTCSGGWNNAQGGTGHQTSCFD